MKDEPRPYVGLHGPYNPVKREAMMRAILTDEVRRAQSDLARANAELEQYEREHGFYRREGVERYTRRNAEDIHD